MNKKLGKIINNINRDKHLQLIFWVVCIAGILLKSVYFHATSQLNSRPVFTSVNILMLISTTGMLFIIISLIAVFFNRKRFIVLALLNVLLTIILAADTNYFRYYYSAITIPMLLQADITLLSSVDESIKSLFTLKDLIYLFDLPILAALLIFIIKKGVTPINIKTRLVRNGALLLVGLMFVIGVYKVSNIGSPVYSNNYVTKTMGVFYFHVDNTKRFFQNQFKRKELTKKDKEKIEEYFKEKTVPTQNYRGIAKGKNLIVIQVEALQEFVINQKVMGREITPNLNKLLKESLFFNNYYYQVAGGNTSDAEFLSNTSLYPLKEGAVFYRRPDNFYYSLPKTLKEQGYTTYALHAFGAKFYNRQQMYNSIGFDKFINSEAFKLDDFAGWKGNALSDSSFFRQSLDIIDTSKPFYSFFLTLSSHHPYVYFKDFDFDVGEYQETYLGNYFKAINYADKCLGEFIENLKNRGLYDKSLLVIYGDHFAIPKVESEDFMKFLNKKYNDVEWMKLQKVPLIIRYPGLRNGQVDNLTGGEIDLLPTVANLMGFNYKYALGKDLLNNKKGNAVLRNGTVVTDNYCYLNDIGGVYSLKTGKKLDKSKYQKEIDTLTKGLDISDLILDKNALAGLK